MQGEIQKDLAGASSKISFRPVTDGLGFHPFSDGLPYAPIIPNAPSIKNPKGGSSSATKVGFQNTKSPALRGSPRGPAHRISVPTAAPLRVFSQQKQGEVRDDKQTNQVQHDMGFGYSYLCKRVGAYLLDGIINTFVCILGAVSLIWIQEISPEIFMDANVAVVAILTLVLLHWVLMTAQEVVFKTTLGKQCFGLAFRGNGFLLLLRAILFVPSVCSLGLGIFWSLIDRKKACWHDKATQLQPIEL